MKQNYQFCFMRMRTSDTADVLTACATLAALDRAFDALPAWLIDRFD